MSQDVGKLGCWIVQVPLYNMSLTQNRVWTILECSYMEHK
jgi:hypothetical protein